MGAEYRRNRRFAVAIDSCLNGFIAKKRIIFSIASNWLLMNPRLLIDERYTEKRLLDLDFRLLKNLKKEHS